MPRLFVIDQGRGGCRSTVQLKRRGSNSEVGDTVEEEEVSSLSVTVEFLVEMLWLYLFPRYPVTQQLGGITRNRKKYPTRICY